MVSLVSKLVLNLRIKHLHCNCFTERHASVFFIDKKLRFLYIHGTNLMFLNCLKELDLLYGKLCFCDKTNKKKRKIKTI